MLIKHPKKGGRFGHHQKHVLEFAFNNPGWHTFHKDRTTIQAINSLVKLGLVEVNEYGQFRLKENV